MVFPIIVEQSNGEFVATLVGNTSLKATAVTREEAVAAVRSVIAGQVASGRLSWVEIPDGPITGLFGKYADDPTLQDICDEAYGLRDAEPKE